MPTAAAKSTGRSVCLPRWTGWCHGGPGAASGWQSCLPGDLRLRSLKRPGVTHSKQLWSLRAFPTPLHARMQEAEPQPGGEHPSLLGGVNLGPKSRLGKLAQRFPQAN